MEFCNIADNPVDDISGLIGLSAIRHLDIKGTRVKDFWPLADMADLVYLGIEDDRIDHFYPIKNLERLNDIV